MSYLTWNLLIVLNHINFVISIWNKLALYSLDSSSNVITSYADHLVGFTGCIDRWCNHTVALEYWCFGCKLVYSLA